MSSPANKVVGPLGSGPLAPFKPNDLKSLKSVALIGLVSLAPAALLMFTSFVRINIVLILLRQALGSPQVPGNQVLAALALLLNLAGDEAGRRVGLCNRAIRASTTRAR